MEPGTYADTLRALGRFLDMVRATEIAVTERDEQLRVLWQGYGGHREERLFDQIVRIGRLTAKERVLNLLLELYDRLDAIGLVKENTFRIPLTQEVFADALGLSVVHINRTMQQLRREGMVTVGRGAVTLHQRHKLASFACYQSEGQHGYDHAPGQRAYPATSVS